MAITHSKPFGEPKAVATQLDWNGAAEVTFEYRGDSGYEWPLFKEFAGATLRRVSSRELKEYSTQTYVVQQATYRGRLFGRDAVSIEGTVTNEPITAHPRFANAAGTVEEPDTEVAIWEQKNGVNTFVQWRDDSPYAGMEFYLAPEWTASVEWLSTTLVSTFQPGIIYELPQMDTFEDDSSFEWLCSTISQQPHGNAYRITAQLIGATEWPATIYSTT